MPLLEMIETIGAIWLAMSAVGFVLFAYLVKPRQQSASTIIRAKPTESISPPHDAEADRQVGKLRAMLDVTGDKSERDRRRDARKVPASVE